jgi:cation-transporting ATPase G
MALTTHLPWRRPTSASLWGRCADVAIETADVALMGENLDRLPLALQHAQRARRIMVQNISLSLAIVGTLVPLALLGVLGLATVVLIHELAEVVVIGNGVRAGNTRRFATELGHPAVLAEEADRSISQDQDVKVAVD